MKILPQFLRNRPFNFFLGTVFILCLGTPSFSQDNLTPLSIPQNTEYPGIIQTFESLLQIDSKKMDLIKDKLLKEKKVLSDSKKVENLELQPDFLNSIILHSKPGYIKLASVNKCRFYESILTDLLKTSHGRIENVFVTYITTSEQRESAILSKKDFLSNVVNQECPEVLKFINKYQIKTLSETLSSVIFESPSTMDQCRISHLSWKSNPNTPYLCQIHEYLNEGKRFDLSINDTKQRDSIRKILNEKISSYQKDFINNLCDNLDDENNYCEKFLNVSFWSKIANQQKEKIYLQDICKNIQKKNVLSDTDFQVCINRIKSEPDQCLFSKNKFHHLMPNLDCETLSTALNHSSLKSDYDDCPGQSDQFAATHFSRLIMDVNDANPKNFSGPCSVVSSGEISVFKGKFDNEENWSLKACYFDKIKEREICENFFFGNYDDLPYSYTNIVAKILKETRGAEKSLQCSMISTEEYNPLYLQYKNGCHIVYDKNECFMSHCKHKIIYNDRTIDFIKITGRNLIELFPLSIKNERFSMQYLFKNDFKQSVSQLSNLTSTISYFKKSKKNLIYGIGCAEDLLPSFFKTTSLNQCSPLPFIIDGIVREENETAFVVRTSADSLQSPRLIGWSNIFSGVKSYQKFHPLKLWTLYGVN